MTAQSQWRVDVIIEKELGLRAAQSIRQGRCYTGRSSDVTICPRVIDSVYCGQNPAQAACPDCLRSIVLLASLLVHRLEDFYTMPKAADDTPRHTSIFRTDQGYQGDISCSRSMQQDFVS